MKVSEIPYVRYTLEELQTSYAKIKSMLENANCADDVLEAHKVMTDVEIEYSTAASLAHCRFTLNTKDPFYQAEVA